MYQIKAHTQGRLSVVTFDATDTKYSLYFPVLFLKPKDILTGKGKVCKTLVFDGEWEIITKQKAQRLWHYLVRDGWKRLGK